MNKPKIKVILGSIREGRNGKKVADWLMNVLKENQDADLELLDLAEFPMPLFADSDAVRNRTGPHPIPAVEKWLEKIREANGFIIITPEYNHSYSSALKNAIDYGYADWNNKPVGFVGYGGYAGGARAVEHLRQIAAELQMYDVRDQLVIIAVWQAFDQAGNMVNGESQAATAKKILSEVITAATKLQA